MRLTALAVLLSTAPACSRDRGVRPGVSGSASVQQITTSEALFASDDPLRIQIELGEEGAASLRRAPRRNVRAMVREGGAVFHDVAVHLKGGPGSFRKVDKNPALTLDFDSFERGQRFYGMERIHLNNSVEDPSRCHELLASEMMRRAGVPAARVTLARVEIDGRDVGLYVLKEAVDRRFLKLYFRDPDGAIYEGGPMEDVEALAPHDTLRETAKGDLGELARAAKEPDPEARLRRLSEVLDLDRFVSFSVLEAMLGAHDGYTLNTNNYRLFFDPETRRFEFIPGGLDQIFGEDADLEPEIGGDIARGLVEIEPGKRLYVERMARLRETIFRREPLVEIVERNAARARRLLRPEEREDYDRDVADLFKRIDTRLGNIDAYLAKAPAR